MKKKLTDLLIDCFVIRIRLLQLQEENHIDERERERREIYVIETLDDGPNVLVHNSPPTHEKISLNITLTRSITREMFILRIEG